MSEEKNYYGKAGMLTVSSVIEVINELEDKLKEKLTDLKTLGSICTEQKEEIKELKEELKEMTKEKDIWLNQSRRYYEDIGRMKNMKEIKCCQGCNQHGLNIYMKDKDFGCNSMIKWVLKEDCEVCKGKEKEVIEEKESFVDSWVLWYKVEGMDKAVQQFNLTKEECEIIYGNMNNITYWHMELMG